MIEWISYFYANFAEKCIVFWKNLHSWKIFYTTAGRDGRDKSQPWAEPVFSLLGGTCSSSFLIPFNSQVSIHPIFFLAVVQFMKKIIFIQVWWFVISNWICLSWSFMIWWSKGHYKWNYGLKLAGIVEHLRKDSDLLSFCALCHKMCGWHDL